MTLRNKVIGIFLSPLVIGNLWAAEAISLENLENDERDILILKEQIVHVQEHLLTIDNPRLIIGVGNTPEASSEPGPNPFLENPTDILIDIAHTEGHLKGRSLTLNINNLNLLNLLADTFPETFPVITTDYLVTKYMKLTKDHLVAFYKMLKKGGTLFLPMDANMNDCYTKPAGTVQELFQQAAQELLLSQKLLLIHTQKVNFLSAPKEILQAPIEIAPEEIEAEIQKHKQLPLKFPLTTLTRTERQPIFAQIRALGITTDTSRLTNDILQDDQKLTTFISNNIKRKHINSELYKISEDFMVRYVIPQNLKHITAQVFPAENITVEKNMALLQPHRDLTAPTYSLVARK